MIPKTEKLSNNRLNVILDDIKVNGIQGPIKYVEYNGKMYVDSMQIMST